jgi:hypothetical protein
MSKRPVYRELLTERDIQMLKKMAISESQKGSGIRDIFQMLSKKLGPGLKSILPKLFEDVIMPLIRRGKNVPVTKDELKLLDSKADPKGSGLSLAGGRYKKRKGSGLKLAGQGRKMSRWNAHVSRVRIRNPGLSFKEAVQLAKKTYKK